MPVDENIDLTKPLTDAQLKKLERDAEKLEIAAEKAERAADKINNEMRQAASSLLEAEKFMGTGPLAGMGGNDEFESTASNFLGIGGTGVEDESLPSKGRRSEQGKAKTSTAYIESNVIDESNKLEIQKLKEMDKKHNAELKQLTLNDQEQQRHNQMVIGRLGAGQQKINQAFSFKHNPVGFVSQKLTGIIGKTGLAGMIAVVAFQAGQEVYNQIMNEVKDLYKPGGALDVRKDTLNAIAQVSALETVVDNAQGRVFFTSSTGEILRQGVPQDYNTRGKINGYKQYLQEFDR